MEITSEQRGMLLLIARRAVEAAVCRGEPPAPVTQVVLCDEPRCGVFVTIRTNGQLRGCIGRLVGDHPLPQLVTMMAASAATQDPRFTNNRLRPHEVRDCHIEISVLSPLERIANPLDFEIGKHGIYLRAGNRAGCFLPQVGPDFGWTAEQMLTQCCTRKAGLAADAWRNGDAEVFRFTVEMIEEPHTSQFLQAAVG